MAKEHQDAALTRALEASGIVLPEVAGSRGGSSASTAASRGALATSRSLSVSRASSIISGAGRRASQPLSLAVQVLQI